MHLAGSKFLFLYEGLQNLTQYCASFNSVPDKGWIFGRGLFLCPLFSFYNFFVSKDKTLKLQKCQKTYLGIFLSTVLLYPLLTDMSSLFLKEMTVFSAWKLLVLANVLIILMSANFKNNDELYFILNFTLHSFLIKGFLLNLSLMVILLTPLNKLKEFTFWKWISMIHCPWRRYLRETASTKIKRACL